MKSPFLFLPLGLFLSAGFAFAEFREARVTQVIQDVKILPGQAEPRPAVVNDPVSEGTAVRTGVESRTELTFVDLTIARLGANTIFSFDKGERAIDLGSGAVLLRVPKNSGGAKINTAAVTAAITGTTVLAEYNCPNAVRSERTVERATCPDALFKFIAIEGSMRVCKNGSVTECVDLLPGQMLVGTADKPFSEPVDVDLERLLETSLLIQGFPPLPSDDLMQASASDQMNQKERGQLVDTSGNQYGHVQLFATDPIDQRFAAEGAPSPSPSVSPSPSASPSPSPSASPSPSPSVSPTPVPTPSKFGTPPVITAPNLLVIDSSTVLQTDPSITRNGETDYGRIYRDQTQDGPRATWLFGATSSFDIASGFEGGFDTSAQLNQMAVFKFLTLQLAGNPTIDTSNGGVFNLGLISVGNLTTGGSGLLNFAGINTLLLATQNGSIILGSEVSFDVERIFIYARGLGSNLTIGSAINAADDLRLYSEGTVQVNGNATTLNFSSFSGGDFLAGTGLITGGGIYITSLNNIDFNAAQFSAGAFTDISVSLNATNALNIDPSGGDQTVFSRLGRFDAVGGTINIFVPGFLFDPSKGPAFTIVFSPSAERTRFEAGLGGIQASSIAFDAANLELISEGDINVFGVAIPIVNNSRQLQGTITAGGAFDAFGDVITSVMMAGTSVSVGGELFVFNVTAGTTINVGGRLTGFGTATAGGDITADSTAIPNIVSPTGTLYVGSGGINPFVQVPGGSALQHTITVSTIVSPNGINFSGNQFFGTDGFFSGGRLTINADMLRFDAENGVGAAYFDGADGFGFDWSPDDGRGGDGGIFIVNTTGDLFVGENISATTGLNDPDNEGASLGGAGGQVTLDSSAGVVTVNSTIQVSSNEQVAEVVGFPLRRSASGGSITLHSGVTGGEAITLNETSRLLSYLSASAPGPGGMIQVLSDGGDITANGEIVANRGTIIISNLPPGGPAALLGGSFISLDGSFASITAETLSITSGGNLFLGLESGLTLNVVTATLSAVNSVTGGDLRLTGDDAPVFALNSSGDANITAGGAIQFNSLLVERANGGRSTGLNVTVDAGGDLSITSGLTVSTEASGLTNGGNITLRSGNNMSLGQSATVSTGSDADTTLGANILFDSGGTLSAGSLVASVFVDDVNLATGGNITLNALGDVTISSTNPDATSELALNISLINDGSIGTGGNIMVTVGGNLTADTISAQVNGLGAITNGGNITFDITGNLDVQLGDASFTIGGPLFPARPLLASGPAINVSAANISVGNSDFPGSLHAYIDDSNGSGPPTGATAGSVLIESLGTINVFGALNVLGTVTAGGDINAGTISSTTVISDTLIAAGFGGIRRFTLPGRDDAPVEILHTLTAPLVTSLGGINFDGVNGQLGDVSTPATHGGALTINADTLTIQTLGILGGVGLGTIEGSVTFNGGNSPSILPAGNGGTFIVNTTGALNVFSDVEATSGATLGIINTPSGNGGSVELNSTNGQVSVNSRIEVSSAATPTPGPRRLSNRGGNIKITSGRSAAVTHGNPRTVAINIGSSSQLLALLDAAATGPGGKITILATGANTDVNVKGRSEATRGTIDVRHQGDGGHVNIGGIASSATMSADVIKAGAFGANGQLNIGNSTISGDSLIRLYATGSNGELNFVANTTLSSGTRIDLAANTITIQPSVIVTISGTGGAANIYTNNANYSGPGGSNPANGFFGGNGANPPQPLASAPPFNNPPPPRPPSQGGTR